MATFVDSHVHLADSAFDADRDAVIERARLTGARALICIGESIAAAERAKTIAAQHAGYVYFTVGVHPHDAAGFDARRDIGAIRAAVSSGAVAIGECGLDYHYDRSPREVQREMFAAQVRLAKTLKKPVVVHTREADADTAAILEGEMGPERGVIHCFTGDWAAAQRYLALGLHISLSGVLTFKAADALRDAAARIPLERLMVETDCPFLAPVPHRGKRNEPAYVRLTAERLAQLRNLPTAEVERATTENARRALRLPG